MTIFSILFFFKLAIFEFITEFSFPYVIIFSGILILCMIIFREKIIDSFKKLLRKTKKAIPEGLAWFRDENPDVIGHFVAWLPLKSLLQTIYCVAFASTMSINFQMPGIIFLATLVVYGLLVSAFIPIILTMPIGLFTATGVCLYGMGNYPSAIISISVVVCIFIISFGMNLFFTSGIIFIQRILRSLLPPLIT